MIRKIGHETRLLTLAALAAAPGLLLAIALLWTGGHAPSVRWGLAVGAAAATVLALGALRGAAMRPLATLANVVSALRAGDFSVRFHPSGPRRDPLVALAGEVNALSSTLREQRLGAEEAAALLHRVMEEIDVAILSFDAGSRAQLANRAAERLLGLGRGAPLGRSPRELGIDDLLAGEAPRVIDGAFPGGAGRYELRRSTFRQGGVSQQLIVLSNLSHVLRQEERQAWQRLIRVLAHELNNSLAPVKSIAASLESLMAASAPPPDRDEDLRRGLGVIRARSESLERFMSAYAQLARLPAPTVRAVELRPLVERVARLETRVPVQVIPGPEATLQADPDQVEQVLINLLKNAAEAARETRGAVSISWARVDDAGEWLDIGIDDDGPGLSDTGNLFVPFFTTKAGGSGIGLVLSRQIAEAHGGTLSLENRRDTRGCRARLRLPA